MRTPAGVVLTLALLASPSLAQEPAAAAPLGAEVRVPGAPGNAPDSGASMADTSAVVPDMTGAAPGGAPPRTARSARIDEGTADAAGAATASVTAPGEVGTVLRRELGGTPLGREQRKEPIGTSVTTVADLQAVFQPRRRAAGKPLGAETDSAAQPAVQVAREFVPRAGEPIGMPTDPEEARRSSQAESLVTPLYGNVRATTSGPAFVQEQLRHQRVVDARLDARFYWRDRFRDIGPDE